MKEFVDRLTNVIGNLNSMPINGYNKDKAIGDIANVSDDLDAYTHPSEMTQQEYDDIQTLSEIAQRNGKQGDGLDTDIVKGIQDAQRTIFLRVGSRHWQLRHAEKP